MRWEESNSIIVEFLDWLENTCYYFNDINEVINAIRRPRNYDNLYRLYLISDTIPGEKIEDLLCNPEELSEFLESRGEV